MSEFHYPSLFNDIKGAHLIVAGEVGIDEYLWGEAKRISPEAPVPVVEVESTSLHLGLAGNVAQNIHSLGAKTTLLSVVGVDSDAKKLKEMTSHLTGQILFLEDETRPTLRKVRVIAQRQHVVRVDYEKSHPLNEPLSKKMNEMICDLLPKADGIILQDYAKGLWTKETTQFIKHARALKKPVFVDPSRLAEAKLYRGATLLTPNLSEAFSLCGKHNLYHRSVSKNDSLLKEIAEQILTEVHSDHIVITCGEAGMVFRSMNDSFQRIPTFAREVFDVTGAGDTVIAAISLFYVLGLPLNECIKLANTSAGLVVAKVGTASVTPIELQEELDKLQGLEVF